MQIRTFAVKARTVQADVRRGVNRAARAQRLSDALSRWGAPSISSVIEPLVNMVGTDYGRLWHEEIHTPLYNQPNKYEDIKPLSRH